MKTLLIISNSDDLHADLIEPIIHGKGASFFRLNLDQFPRDYRFELRYSGEHFDAELHHINSGKTLSISDITAVWLRKNAEFAFINQQLGPQEAAFAVSETEHTLFSLLYSLPVFWMNHPKSVRGAIWKGEQVKRAAKCGFQVPRTLITNNPDSVLAFKSQIQQNMIYKAMASPFLGADKVKSDERVPHRLPTTMVSDEMMTNLQSVEQVPCLFQEYIAKQYELRVTIIGDKVFCAKIHSQEDSRTQTDYRDMSAEITYEATRLPDDIQARCLQLIKSYGLSYGAMDLIVTPDNQYVFLENNPGGQFLFIEQLIPEFQLLDAVAERLIQG